MPDDGVAVLVGERGGHGFEAGVVVGDRGAFGGADVGEFGGTVEGGDAVEDEVAGAVGIELWGWFSSYGRGCPLGGWTYKIDSTGVLGEYVIPVRRQPSRKCGASVPVIEIVDPDEDWEQCP